MSRLIRVFEHEKLTLQKNTKGDCISRSELDKLYSFNDKNGNIYFTGIRDGIKFSSYVGVIQIGNLTIEILPKADNVRVSNDNEYDKWRNVLLSMLAISRKIKIHTVSEANLNKKYHSLLDLYFEIYLDEVSLLLRQGLIKKYRSIETNTTSFKGKINFAKNIQQNLIHKERTQARYQIYDYENNVNQILLKGLSILSKIATNTTIKDRVTRIKANFPEIREIQINKNHFDSLLETRKTVPYTNSLQIAKMIILNYSPDIKNGQDNMLALLFDMNELWETYIYRMLQKNKPHNFKIEFQNSQKFWESKTIRPDIVITKIEVDHEEKYVIDTKWKIIDYRNPSDDDLKQMYAYNIYWDAGKCILLYPKVKDFPEKFGIFHKGRENGSMCKLGFVDLFDEFGKLNLNIGSSILAKMN